MIPIWLSPFLPPDEYAHETPRSSQLLGDTRLWCWWPPPTWRHCGCSSGVYPVVGKQSKSKGIPNIGKMFPGKVFRKATASPPSQGPFPESGFPQGGTAKSALPEVHVKVYFELDFLSYLGYSCGMLHGSLTQLERPLWIGDQNLSHMSSQIRLSFGSLTKFTRKSWWIPNIFLFPMHPSGLSNTLSAPFHQVLHTGPWPFLWCGMVWYVAYAHSRMKLWGQSFVSTNWKCVTTRKTRQHEAKLILYCHVHRICSTVLLVSESQVF